MTFTFLIRDGLESDISTCIDLDSTYMTDYVWQVSIQQGTHQHTVMFKRERLPRSMEVDYSVPEPHFKAALPRNQCFLVATGKDDPQTLGYLIMSPDFTHNIASIQHLVVDRAFRRRRIATRLLNVAMKWAIEHNLSTLTIETQTKNYPSLMFCQHIGLAFSGYNDQYFTNQDIAVFFSRTLR